ncbi:MAG: oligopeptide/dipeptide ABC transporter ATP-binding protein [Candidatus Limnocylindrales bacterium]
MTTLTENLLEVRDLKVHFSLPGSGLLGPRPTVSAVDGVTLEMARGETMGLVGESGSGKSTTGRAILQLVRPTAGTVRFEGADVTSRDPAAIRTLRRRAQMIFQDPYGSLNSRLSVASIIREPLDIHRLGDGTSRRARVAALLDRVGLPSDAGRRYPHEFSGGQRQRIGIARALALDPSLVICDEPVAALDVSIQAQVLQLLDELQRELGMAYLFIAHDLHVVRHVSRRAAVMYLGRVVERGASRTIFSTPRHPYTQALVSAVPIADPTLERSRRRVVLYGEIPSPTNPPSGCRFRTRCPYAQEVCANVEPVLEDAGDGTDVACHFWRDLPNAGRSARPVEAVSSNV